MRKWIVIALAMALLGACAGKPSNNYYTGGNLSQIEANILGLSPADTGVTPYGNEPSVHGGGVTRGK